MAFQPFSEKFSRTLQSGAGANNGVSKALSPASQYFKNQVAGNNGSASGGNAYSARNTSKALSPASQYFKSQADGLKANYTPHSDVESIVTDKNSYMNREYAGNKAEAESFRESAKPHYESLRQNGYTALANRLENAGTTDAARMQSDLAFDKYKTDTRTNTNRILDNSLVAAEARYKQEKADLEREHQDAAREYYVNYLRQQNLLPQQLKAQGITGGLSESSAIALANGYGQQVSENEKNRLASLRSLNADLEETRQNVDNARLDTENDLSAQTYERAQNQYNLDWQAGETQKERNWQTNENEKSRDQSNTQFWAQMQQQDKEFDRQMEYNRDTFDQQMAYNRDTFDRQMNLQEKQNAESFAMDSAAYGDFSALANLLGITPQQAENAYFDYLYSVQGIPYALERGVYNYTPKTSQSSYGNASAQTNSGGNDDSSKNPY